MCSEPEEEGKQLLKEREKNKDLQLANVTQVKKEQKEMFATLTELQDKLENQIEQQKNHRTEMQKLLDENKTELKKVVKDINEKNGDETDIKAWGYLSLKEIMLKSNRELEKILNEDLDLEVKREELLEMTKGLIRGITEREKEGKGE